MPKTALILGASGRFGRHMQAALTRHGWQTRAFNRATDTLPEAAKGTDLIVYGWNPRYSQWAAQVPGLTQQVIAAAKSSGAAVLFPGNVYVYGEDLPPVIGPNTPHRATNHLGQIRRQMEQAYRDAGVKTVILRAADYIDTEASENWFHKIIIANLAKGRVSYPGPMDQPHPWAYLPDLAEAGARLAGKLDTLPTFSDFMFEGYTLTGAELAQAIETAIGQPVPARSMSWLPIHLMRPVWAEAKHLVEMRYLWRRPHRCDGSALDKLLPDLHRTPLNEALQKACAPMLQKSTSTQTSRWSEA
jgi:nucleoside-diphosphate-sugar epimerase